MAQLIKIGIRYVNLQQITEIIDFQHHILIFPASREVIDVENPEEVAALRRFLKMEAHDTIDWHRAAIKREAEEEAREVEAKKFTARIAELIATNPQAVPSIVTELKENNSGWSDETYQEYAEYAIYNTDQQNPVLPFKQWITDVYSPF